MDKRITLKISKIEDETKDIKTFTFNHKLNAKPGQFIMLTDFEGGEKPFSISDCSENEFSITVKKIGEFTSRLFQKGVGDYMSVRGAFGSSFFVSNGKVLLVGGGYGSPPLYFLAKKLLKAGANIAVVNGAQTKDDLVFCDRFSKLGIKYQNITEAGCLGRKGTSVDLAKGALTKEKFDFIYAAGPEMMMKALQGVIGEDDYEFLFERYMKCAIGICGNCTMDPLGIRLCVEGPVLPKKIIEQLTEFGKYRRDASGKRIRY
ncbi:MAG: dihydroorotate dehydrogenase electron transfer subunit [Candidatus Cloacimonetes bacterium]|nr:dihydroorotate dehydrogenase electron transfer subunit [Candidatus Cloacimonadota bacterium]